MSRQIPAVCPGGAPGASSRYGCGLAITAWPGEHRSHHATWGVNVTGCLLAGVILARVPATCGLRAGWREFLVAGFPGSLTTFSAFSPVAMGLIEKNVVPAAVLYVSSSVAVGMVTVRAGIRPGRTRL